MANPGRGMRSFLTEEEKANAPKVTLPLLKRIFSYFSPHIQFYHNNINFVNAFELKTKNLLVAFILII